MNAFIRTLARLAALADEDLAGEARWKLLFRALEIEQGAVVRARLAYRGTEAQRILGLAQVAYGDLRGLLAGVGADALDRVPREGEWSARETMRHTTAVERSYRANTAHALRRGPDEPLTLPAERRPSPDPADIEGDGSNVAERLG
ncbi:MAG: DinB family protein, partial [Chloroflexi bacterium]|nr:DinB family protein [Chloroflexota bacterium]